MPIDGPEDPMSRHVPVIWQGQEMSIDPDQLKYSLDAAQATVNATRGVHCNPEDPESIPFLLLIMDKLNLFMRSAEEVVQTCRQKIEQLKTKRGALHGKTTPARYDEAISRLEAEMNRHVRVQSRLSESMRQVQGQIAAFREAQKRPRIRAKPADY